MCGRLERAETAIAGLQRVLEREPVERDIGGTDGIADRKFWRGDRVVISQRGEMVVQRRPVLHLDRTGDAPVYALTPARAQLLVERRADDGVREGEAVGLHLAEQPCTLRAFERRGHGEIARYRRCAIERP